jgi:hypothetical protein
MGALNDDWLDSSIWTFSGSLTPGPLAGLSQIRIAHQSYLEYCSPLIHVQIGSIES